MKNAGIDKAIGSTINEGLYHPHSLVPCGLAMSRKVGDHRTMLQLRRSWLWLIAGSIPIIVVACGIEDGGVVTVAPNDDAGPLLEASNTDAFKVQDAGPKPDTSLPPVCATVDASCVPNVPAGWTLFGVASGSKPCPSIDFDPFPLVTNPRLQSGSCTCGTCNVSGNYVCGGGVTIQTGPSCGGPTDTKNSSPACVSRQQSNSDARISGTPAPATGVPTCSIASIGTKVADTDAVTGCRPNKCEANYCGLKGAGFQTCIAHDNVIGCPSGFNLLTQVGTAGTATCDPCTCGVDPAAACTGKIRVFNGDNGCDGNGATSGPDYKTTVVADGTCKNPGTNFDSLYYIGDPAAPATCKTTAGGTGQAGLTGVKTICCAP